MKETINRVISILLIIIIITATVLNFDKIGEFGFAVAFTLVIGLVICIKDGDNILYMVIDLIVNMWKALLAFLLLFGFLALIFWPLFT